MFLSKAKFAAALLAASALLLGVGGVYRMQATGQAPDVPAAADVPPDDGDSDLELPCGTVPVQVLARVDGNQLLVRIPVTSYALRENPYGLPAGGQVSYEPATTIRTLRYGLTKVRAYDTHGKRMDSKVVANLLGAESPALASADGRPVDPLHLRLIKDGVVVLVLPKTAAAATTPPSPGAQPGMPGGPGAPIRLPGAGRSPGGAAPGAGPTPGADAAAPGAGAAVGTGLPTPSQPTAGRPPGTADEPAVPGRQGPDSPFHPDPSPLGPGGIRPAGQIPAASGMAAAGDRRTPAGDGASEVARLRKELDRLRRENRRLRGEPVGGPAQDVFTVNARRFRLPLHVNPAARVDLLRLYVSRDQGRTWAQAAELEPTDLAEGFAFDAPADGVYWFIVQMLDKDGRKDPETIVGATPQVKVRVATQATFDPAGR
jgi:hypothetical protein